MTGVGGLAIPTYMAYNAHGMHTTRSGTDFQQPNNETDTQEHTKRHKKETLRPDAPRHVDIPRVELHTKTQQHVPAYSTTNTPRHTSTNHDNTPTHMQSAPLKPKPKTTPSFSPMFPSVIPQQQTSINHATTPHIATDENTQLYSNWMVPFPPGFQSTPTHAVSPDVSNTGPQNTGPVPEVSVPPSVPIPDQAPTSVSQPSPVVPIRLDTIMFTSSTHAEDLFGNDDPIVVNVPDMSHIFHGTKALDSIASSHMDENVAMIEGLSTILALQALRVGAQSCRSLCIST